MKILRAYLQERLGMLLAALVLAGVAAFLFYLHGLPFDALGYILLVTGVLCLLLFGLPGYVRYARRVKKIEEVRESLGQLLQPPPAAGTLPERLLLDVISGLCGRVREMETAHISRQADMLEYYTLWVHQIKTPIAAMRLILQSQPGAGKEALAQELFKIERYVEMVLGYLRLETMSQDLQLESCSLRRVAAQAAKKLAPQFIYKKLSFQLGDFKTQVVTDEKWLLFVLEQLLSNAVKYTRSGGVSVTVEEGDVLLIRDTGIGIAPEDLPRVFQRGFTGRNGRSDKTSTGLGLYLVKQVLDKLQTPIQIQSRVGEGTQVRLYLGRGPAPRD